MRIKNYFINFSILFLLLPVNYTFAQSIDPNGEIYITRATGDLSNCGPIAALMLSKFRKKTSILTNLTKRIQEIRKTIQTNPESNRWWRINDIKKFFNHEKIKHQLIQTKNKYTIKKQLDKNSAVIINVNMNNLARGNNTGKPYFTFPGGWGHFLVVVGYKKINNKLMYEVHDSYIKGGNNRLYDANEIQKALISYNPKMIVVQR